MGLSDTAVRCVWQVHRWLVSEERTWMAVGLKFEGAFSREEGIDGASRGRPVIPGHSWPP